MRPRGEVDITAGFEPAGGGSIPSEGIEGICIPSSIGRADPS